MTIHRTGQPGLSCPLSPSPPAAAPASAAQFAGDLDQRRGGSLPRLPGAGYVLGQVLSVNGGALMG